MKHLLLQKDIQAAMELFPKLKFKYNSESKDFFLIGTIDICDTKGNYWDSFEVLIIIEKGYPYTIPILIETSNKIPRCEDRHISEEGICCLDIPHNILLMEKRGINLASFIRTKIYPYFANQLYFNKEGKYASGEWLHDDDGIIQFYKTVLRIEDKTLAINIINSILNNNIPHRNDPCLCKKDKFKRCHYDSVILLKDLGKERLVKDLEIFNTI